ncbi:MAG: hypothetical protein FGF53_02095 [Candidatus Brockarchaeota archaeon]|nr:hypothetical protein [Candidatus Brockarchaeota archaeon]
MRQVNIKAVLRSLWYYSILGNWYEIVAYRSVIVTTAVGTIGSFLTYYFLGYSIIYQRGILEYGVSMPLGFILSGLLLSQIANPFRYNFPLHLSSFYYSFSRTRLLSQIANPFRYNFPLHLSSFYYSFSRPIPPYLILIQTWLSIYVKFNAYPVLIYAIAIASLKNLSMRLESILLFLVLWMTMSIGLNFLENGVVYITKKAEPVSLAFRFFEYVFSGQYFPLTILPPILQQFVWLLPYSWAYLVWRKILFEELPVISLEYFTFIIASISTFLVGLCILRKGYNKIYCEGLVL